MNHLRSLFNLMKTEPLTKRCPLIWRLYLRFLYIHGTEDVWRTALYRAVKESRWVKTSVVVDANVDIVFCAVFVFYKYGGEQGGSNLNVVSIKYMSCSDEKVLRV